MWTFIFWLIFIWIIVFIIYAFCHAHEVQVNKEKMYKLNAEKYDEKKKEEKKMKEKSKWNASWYSLEDENVKKIYKELKTWKAIEDIAKDLKIKKGEVYDIKIFLEDEWML